jgi:hypothetical protein
MENIIIVLVITIAMGFLSAKIAEGKRRDQTVWFILGALFGLIAVIVISLLPAL